ncbi:MAG: hypothetical protein OXB98_06570 [Bryobacterales bacterium]|nr:hypothetical protein [Bryobacterales bacterium]
MEANNGDVCYHYANEVPGSAKYKPGPRPREGEHWKKQVCRLCGWERVCVLGPDEPNQWRCGKWAPPGETEDY